MADRSGGKPAFRDPDRGRQDADPPVSRLVDEVIKEALKHTGQSRTGRTIKVEEEDELILAKMDAS